MRDREDDRVFTIIRSSSRFPRSVCRFDARAWNLGDLTRIIFDSDGGDRVLKVRFQLENAHVHFDGEVALYQQKTVFGVAALAGDLCIAARDDDRGFRFDFVDATMLGNGSRLFDDDRAVGHELPFHVELQPSAVVFAARDPGIEHEHGLFEDGLVLRFREKRPSACQLRRRNDQRNTVFADLGRLRNFAWG